MNLSANKISNKYNVDIEKVSSALMKIENKESILFAMSGKMGSGKDTVGDKIPNNAGLQRFNLKRLSYAAPLRAEIVEVLEAYKSSIPRNKLELHYNVNIDKIAKLHELLGNDSIYARTANARKAIQYWGTDVRRKQDGEYWVKKVVALTIDEINLGNSIYITDVRFPNEANSVTDLDGKIIRLEVPDNIRSERIYSRDGLLPTIDQLDHFSEMALDSHVFDIVFDGCKTPDILAEEASKYILNN